MNRCRLVIAAAAAVGLFTFATAASADEASPAGGATFEAQPEAVAAVAPRKTRSLGTLFVPQPVPVAFVSDPPGADVMVGTIQVATNARGILNATPGELAKLRMVLNGQECRLSEAVLAPDPKDPLRCVVTCRFSGAGVGEPPPEPGNDACRYLKQAAAESRN